MSASDAKKASYFFASFLTNFLFLFSLRVPSHEKLYPEMRECHTYFFKSSTDMYSRSICFARSMSAASARIQIDMRGRGTLGSLRMCQHTKWAEKAKQTSLDSARETLVTLGVIVFQTNLKFDGLYKVAALLAS